MLSKKPRALLITQVINIMCITVNFDNQFRIVRRKIRNEFTNYLLTPKFNAFKSPRAKLEPQPCLGFGHVLAHRARELG